nr:MAG TPA: hypothetical protein [Caudoviricetes sp.]
MSHAKPRQNTQFLMQIFVQYAYCCMLNIVVQYRQDQTRDTHPHRTGLWPERIENHEV